jgi:hypothetical protein
MFIAVSFVVRRRGANACMCGFPQSDGGAAGKINLNAIVRKLQSTNTDVF